MKLKSLQVFGRERVALFVLFSIILIGSSSSSVYAYLDRALFIAPTVRAPEGQFTHILGNDHTQDGGFTDLHNPGLFINESKFYTNKSVSFQNISVDTFNFYAKKTANPVTPIILSVNGDNDFTVMAIGTTRGEYALGANTFNFSDTPTTISVPAGGKIITGFMDADANGQGWGKGGNPIPASGNGFIGTKSVANGLDQDEVFGLLPDPLIHFDPNEPDYEAYDPSIDTPAVVVGQNVGATNQGKALNEYDLLRSYHYSIGFSADHLFNGATVYTERDLQGTSHTFSDGITQLANTPIGEGTISSISVRKGYVAYLCKKLVDHPTPSFSETEVCKMYSDGDFVFLPDFDNEATFIKVDQNDPYRHGRWGDVVEMPQRAIAAAQTPDGRVMFWQGGDAEGIGKEISIVDPATMKFGQAVFGSTGAPTNHDTFCPGPALMPNGSLILAGGGRAGTPLDPPVVVTENASSIFSWTDYTWIRTEDMAEPHYYGTSVGLPDGRVFHALGSTLAANDWEFQSDNPEIWNGSSWEKLTGIDVSGLHADNGYYNSNYYPFLHLMPNSNVFHSGGVPTMHEIDPNRQQIYSVGTRAGSDHYRHWGNAIMIDEGLLFISGGRQNEAISTRSTVLIDINDELDIKSEFGNDMSYDRAFHNMVQLPTGDVFVSGGQSSGKIFVDYGTVYPTEMWDRESGTWTEMAELTTPRNYHSTSLLLPDGRIWQAGGDCEHCPEPPDYPATKSFKHHNNAQIYSPAYLFNPDGNLAARPEITSYPEGVDGVVASTTFNISVDGSGKNNISDFAMIKMSSTTHQINTDVRRLSLPFTKTGDGAYTLEAHDNINVMTPGYWMLFAINSSGVPSEAAIVHVSTTPGTVNPTPQPKPIVVSVGNPSTNLGAPDAFNSNLIINESDTYLNEFSVPEQLSVNTFDFYAANTGGPITPFIVKVKGDNDFEVKAIGNTRVPTESGANSFPFSDSGPITITLEAAEVIAIGFMDSYADGSSPPPERSIVAANFSSATANDEIYYVGAANGVAASITVGEAPELFAVAREVSPRDYAFSINMEKIIDPDAPTPNKSPVLTHPGDQSNEVGEAVDLQIIAQDGNGDDLVFTINGLPDGLVVDTAGKVSGNLTDKGIFLVDVNVDDGNGGTDIESFVWKVTQPGIEIISLGNPAELIGSADNWRSNIVVNEADTFKNETNESMTISIDTFEFYAATANGPVTPFIVRVNSDNDFTVAAVGNTRIPNRTGAQIFPFRDGGKAFVTVQPGETLATGFLDAYADGNSNGPDRSVIPYIDGGDSIWYAGKDSGIIASVLVGSAPKVEAGVQVFTGFSREYSYFVTMTEAQFDPTEFVNTVYIPLVTR
ncbi:MAG: galactose oxidase-like domain-containing protein [Chloroflexota bacterium]